MEMLRRMILEKGRIIGDDILKTDSFLNHQIDPVLMDAIGQAFYHRFCDHGITKILTVEASGIAVAGATARLFGVPYIFAKKQNACNLDNEIYTSEIYSFTKKTTCTIRVAKEYLQSQDRVLVLDDFLANGQALLGLIEICKKAGATVLGCGIVIEKAFQGGAKKVEEKGIEVFSLVRIGRFENAKPVFL